VRADSMLADIPGAHLVLTVHDEIVLTAPEEHAKAAADVLREAMLGPDIQKLVKVPLTSDIKTVDRWSEAK
jgi:DNA polymerase I-like protein with 3'-5' exonuclease and polymerase domains